MTDPTEDPAVFACAEGLGILSQIRAHILDIQINRDDPDFVRRRVPELLDILNGAEAVLFLESP